MANAILWYEVKNFGSFEDEGGLVDLTTSTQDSHKDLWHLVDGNYVNIITAIMGANASGKTTLLKPLPFLAWMFWKIPEKASERLLLNTNKPIKGATQIKICFMLNGKQYTYEIMAFDYFIMEENLFVKNENNKNIYVFKRSLCKKKCKEYAEKLGAINSTKEMEELQRNLTYDYVEKKELFPLGLQEARRTPSNTSIISSARRIGIELATDIAFYMSSYTNVNAMGRSFHSDDDVAFAAKFLYEFDDLFKKLKKIIKRWDLGLTDLEIEKKEVLDQSDEKEEHYKVRGIHEKEDGTKFTLPMSLESAGTQSAFVRLFRILCALEWGNPCVIDELGDDLHPHMIKPILELFINKETNPKGCQLIFTCHKPELINYLGKYRVIIVEKKSNKSECYRLDDFPASEARVDENLAAKYLSGTFGGVPEL